MKQGLVQRQAGVLGALVECPLGYPINLLTLVFIKGKVVAYGEQIFNSTLTIVERSPHSQVDL